jgi:hypothetical protein
VLIELRDRVGPEDPATAKQEIDPCETDESP